MTAMIDHKLVVNWQNALTPDSYQNWLPPQEFCQSWVMRALKSAQYQNQAEITIRLVDINEIQQLNRDYRQQDKPTNILSFEADLPDFIESPFLGDLAICPKILANEAKLQHKDLQNHWAHILIHGCLHLLGYDHVDVKEAEIMEQLEINLLKQYGIDNPYQ